MAVTPDYTSYTWAQLQDALASASMEQYAALQAEIERRLEKSPLPEVESLTNETSTEHSTAISRWQCAVVGALFGAPVGVFVGNAAFLMLYAHSPAIRPLYGNYAIIIGGAGLLLCTVAGFLLGLTIGSSSRSTPAR